MQALDTWQDTRPVLACLTNNGVSVVGRYYSTSEWKRMTKAEAEALSNAGFTIFVVYQDSNNAYSKFSRQRGVTHARTALEYATNVIGQPAGTAIYFSVDYDASPTEVSANIRQYFEGIAEEFAKAGNRYKAGVYGNGAACSKLLDLKLVEFTWLSMSTGHYGHKDFYKSKRWSLCQKLEAKLCGLDVDPDELNPDVGFGGFSLLPGFAAAAAGKGKKAQAAAEAAALAAAPGWFVKTEGVNFRELPDGNVIRPLTLGEPIEMLGDAEDPKWKRIRVAGREGYAAGMYLRPAGNAQVETLLRNAIAQWVRFNKGAAQEEEDPYCQYVGEMWRAINLNYDGRSKYPDGRDVPWSAAFISFVVRQSGAKYSNFRFADAHSVFVHDAIQARLFDRTDRPFWGYRINEKKPALGDIVARNRSGNTYSYDFAETNSRYESHSDFVVEVKDTIIRVMGGNVGDTVSMRSFDSSGDNLQEYDLDESGFIRPGQKVIAVLKNRAAEV